MMRLFIIRRRLAPGGIYIILQHKECGGEAPVFIPDKSELKNGWPLRCSLCLQETTFYFGDPKLGRRLLEILKRPLPEDKFNAATDRPPNN